MKTHAFSLIALTIMFASVFTACKKDKDVTGVTLNVASKTLSVNETLTLTATVLPENATNKNVTWSTSNANVASVADGVVTAKGGGKATITVTTVDGGKTATCAVTVLAPLPKDWDVEGYGKGNFASETTWIVGQQEWSDAVQTTGTDKTTFVSAQMGPNTTYFPDGCSNPGRKGDLFSWEMVNQLGNALCPEGWRVPSKTDFETLNAKLGGTAYINQTDLDPEVVKEFIGTTYLNPEKWGGDLGGFRPFGPPTTQQAGAHAWYWSSTEADASIAGETAISLHMVYSEVQGYSLFIDNGGTRDYGCSLRCVRDL